MSVKQRLPGGHRLLSGLKAALLAVGMLALTVYSVGAGHTLVAEGPTAGIWHVLLGTPGVFAAASAVGALWVDDAISVRLLARWTITGALLIVWLPAGAAALMTVSPSAVTAVMLFASVGGPLLFITDLYYDVPVLTPLVDEGRLAWEVSA